MKITSAIIQGFVKKYLLSKYDEPSPVPEFHKELWDIWCSNKRSAVAAPRGFAKTTCVGGYILASVCFRDKNFIILCSDTAAGARNFLSDIREEFALNDALKEDFKIQDFDVESKTEIIVRFKDGHSAKIIAVGAGQQLRGAIKSHAKPDLFIGDDLENDDQVASEQQSTDLKRWLTRTVVPVVSKRGYIHLVGTIIGSNALLESLMPESITPPQDHDKYIKFNGIKTWSELPGASWASVRYQAHDFPSFTKFLWEDRYDQTYLMERLGIYQAQKDEEGYYREYLNKPITSRLGFLPTENLQYIPEQHIASLLQTPHRLICSVDLATSEKSSADESAFLVGAITPDNSLYLVNLIHGRFSSTDILELFFQLNKTYKNLQFITEHGALFNVYSRLLGQESAKRGQYLCLQDIPLNGNNKAIRAKAIQYRLKSKTVYVPEGTDWMPVLVKQLNNFSALITDEQYKKKHIRDDIVDTMSLLCDRVYDISSFMDEEEEDYTPTGRSMICGY